ncbi:MAG: enoyl-CoA hydratase/isomerase family protein [Ectothiorhodospiraceae bacterium]|nr:enoyl-CoA hydratase/isomerase family protein [Chromatiales bacterium]MCP5154516.1 enoyl-CoA hydratase/isomerase family protein [Ectothiorhodospiraceae bacterium]
MNEVVAERLDGGVLRVAIDRPEKRNPMSPSVRDGLLAALEPALGDDAVRAVVLGSQGGFFCAGGDIESMRDLDGGVARRRMQGHHRLVRLLAACEKPVVAAVEGYAVGAGAGLALLADTIVLGAGATIGFPFFRVGLVPDLGLLYNLPRRVGPARARQLLLRAQMVKGEAALAMGLADELAEDGAVEQRALEIARELARMPPGAFGLAKRQLALAPPDLDTALELETTAQSIAFLGAEFAEGRAAFLEKRKPRF